VERVGGGFVPKKAIVFWGVLVKYNTIQCNTIQSKKRSEKIMVWVVFGGFWSVLVKYNTIQYNTI